MERTVATINGPDHAAQNLLFLVSSNDFPLISLSKREKCNLLQRPSRTAAAFHQEKRIRSKVLRRMFLFIGSTAKTAKRRATGQQQDNVTLPVKTKIHFRPEGGNTQQLGILPEFRS